MFLFQKLIFGGKIKHGRTSSNPVFHSWMVGNQKIIFIELVFWTFISETTMNNINRLKPHIYFAVNHEIWIFYVLFTV